MKTIMKLAIFGLLVAGSSAASADEDTADLREQLKEAKAEVAQLKAQLQQAKATVDELPEAIFMPPNLQKVKVDRDDDGKEYEVKGVLDGGDVLKLAEQAKKQLVDAGYRVVKEDLSDEDEAKLVYEKRAPQKNAGQDSDDVVRETVEIEIEKSWLGDGIDYDVEYEKHGD